MNINDNFFLLQILCSYRIENVFSDGFITIMYNHLEYMSIRQLLFIPDVLNSHFPVDSSIVQIPTFKIDHKLVTLVHVRILSQNGYLGEDINKLIVLSFQVIRNGI